MINLLPVPKQYEIGADAPHAIARAVFCDVSAWQDAIDAFCAGFERMYEAEMAVAADKSRAGIYVSCDASLAANAYRLHCTDGAIEITVSAMEGLNYALASVLFLVDCKSGVLTVKPMRVEDYPEKDWRGFMVDMGIVWHPFDKLLKYVDLCFIYKIKYLHLHVMDDRYYCIPSRAFPKLNKPGKCYTHEQIVELNRYAAARGVVLVPEFECPGHAAILNHAYPEVFSNHPDGEMGKFYNELGAEIDTASLVCAGSEVAFDGVKTLLAEIAELFPSSPYIHIGGDEAMHAWWAQCRDCRAYMERKKIADTRALYGEYVGRVAAYVLSLGRTPIVWEGFSKESAHYVPKETVVIAWESHYQLAHELLENGFKIINASWQPTYFVSSLRRRWSPEDLLDWNIYNWQHWWPSSAATEHPIQLAPTDDLLGAQLCSWGLPYELHISRLMENFPAFAERVWSPTVRLENEVYRDVYKKVWEKTAIYLQDK